MIKEIVNYDELKTQLAFYAEDDYREFVKKGIPCDRPILGVRIPQVRELAKLVPNENIEDLLKNKPVALEEVLFRGFLICRLPYEKIMSDLDGKSWFDSQLECIDNWCTCDVFCASFKKIKKHKSEFFDTKIGKLLEDPREYAVRVGLVLLKSYYIEPDYLAVMFDRTERLKQRDEYYIKMAIAWLLAECFVKYPDETLSYLKVSNLPKWTYNKTISKIRDSFRVDEEMKDLLLKLRK